MITNSAQETIAFGKKIAKFLKQGDIIILVGGLGSGKTTLAKGIAKGLGVKNSSYVNSPTFVLVREYKGRINLFHIDLYRLSDLTDIEDIGLKEYFYSDGVSVIEWGQKLKGLIPQERLEIRIDIQDENSRKIEIKEFGCRYKNIEHRLAQMRSYR